MNYDDLRKLCESKHLTILGGFHPTSEDADFLVDHKTLLMLGPNEPAFWPAFKQSPEFESQQDPMDQWSKRVIGDLAVALDAKAFFPSDGPPFPPFFRWALRTGRCHSSPVRLLVHDTAGMLVSFRGALAMRDAIQLPPAADSPCTRCPDQPCRTACPILALTPQDYDVDGCKSFLRAPQGASCLDGCLVRRSCPQSKVFGRLTEQSRFHQRAFLDP